MTLLEVETELTAVGNVGGLNRTNNLLPHQPPAREGPSAFSAIVKLPYAIVLGRFKTALSSR